MDEKFSQDDMDPQDMEDGDASEEGDFVEEDWDGFDDDEAKYIDDGEGDGGKAMRAANFNKIIIGGAVVLAVAVGGFTAFTAKKEPLGLPTMDQTGKPVAVAEGQKVEFHADTKVAAKDAFGVRYGEVVDSTAEDQAPAAPPAGILNNPALIDEIRNNEVVVVDGSTGAAPPAVVEGQPPMPSPIATDGASAETPGLMPLPNEGDPSFMVPTAQDIALQGDERRAPVDPFAAEPVAEEQASPLEPEAAASLAKSDVDQMMERLGSIESSLAEIEQLRESVDKLEQRIAKMEGEPRKPVAKTSSGSSGSSARSGSGGASAKASQWILKSAQPGKAMVSRKGESDLIDISIGETLAGLGRVTGIFMQDGQWIVQGTNGKISQ